MKAYKAKKKGIALYLLIVALILQLILPILGKVFLKLPIYLSLISLSPLNILIGLLIWLYFDTYYQIENGELRYKSAFIKGKIDINTIKKVTSGETMLVGIKPALAGKGLIIQFNKYDEMYIAPESNNEVINDLLAINKNIVVIKR